LNFSLTYFSSFAEQRSYEMKHKRVLLIEDDRESAFLIKNLLVRIGYQANNILLCGTLREATGVPEEELEIILTDLTLPDSDYDKTFELLHANFSHIPIIVLTGKDEQEFANKTILQGAQDYLVKGTFGQALLHKSIQYAIERNKIHNELARSNADYRRVFDDAPNPMFVFDRHNYEILQVNIAAIRQYGYSRNELPGLNMLDILPEDDRGPYCEILQVLTDKYMDAGNWIHYNKDGTLKHVQIFSHTTKFNDHDAVVTMAVNVDEKIRVKERLKERNKEITDILDSISDGFYTLNSDWVITYVNNAFQGIFNKKKEEVVNTSIWDSFPTIKMSVFYKDLLTAMRERKVAHSIGYSPGAQKWLSVNVYPIKDGLAVYVLNINEEHELQERLLNNDRRLRAIINNTSDIIWSVDHQLNIIEANKPFWDMMRTQTGKSEQELQKGDLNLPFLRAWSKYFKRAFNGEAYKTILTGTGDGVTTYSEISFNPIYGTDESITAVSCFSRDITSEKNYLNRIEEQNAQLKEIAWLQSHKVRSHVATILGLSQFVNKHIVADPDLNEVLNGIQEAARELDVVIKKINNLTKSSAD
jgi:PAS domain S-box-containing protein